MLPPKKLVPSPRIELGSPGPQPSVLTIVTKTGYSEYGGRGGIRTHGLLRVAGFQDRFLQPLGHLSTNRRLVIVAHLPGGCQDVLWVLRKIVVLHCAACGRFSLYYNYRALGVCTGLCRLTCVAGMWGYCPRQENLLY